MKELLEFSKPSDLKLQKTDINSLLDQTLDLLSNDLLHKNIKISKKYHTFSEIKVDPNQMKQVFLNLFLNAIDSMPNGGTLSIFAISKHHSIEILIKDTGRGIAEGDIKHIFDPFFTKKDGGTGLGLSVVHGIIKKHVGKINVISSPDQGSTFTLTLPYTA